jgi:putative hemolysin
LQAQAAYFILLFLFLALSVFFSASETALMAVSRLRLKYLAETGDRRADFIQRIVANPDRLLGVILLGNTLANIGAASLVTYLVATYAPQDRVQWLSLLASVALTLVVLIFCELTPKIIAATHAEDLSRKLVWPIRIFLWLFSPFAALAAFVANGLVRLAGLSAGASPFAHALTEDEIRSIIAASTGAGMGEERKEMLHKVFEIRDTRVREIMIPRTDVTAIDINDPIADTLAVFHKTNYSRIPVYRGTFDDVIGILYVKDLAQHMQRPGDINLQVLLRPVHFVPDSARIEQVLKQMQSMHLHMVVAVDEFGGVEGIVTLEDLLEEIVGEIRDEHDTETEPVHEISPGLFSIAGNLPVRDFNRLFDRDLPESHDYSTIAGFLQTRTGRLLHAGENVRYHELEFIIDRVDGMKIVLVRVRIPGNRSQESGVRSQ